MLPATPPMTPPASWPTSPFSVAIVTGRTFIITPSDTVFTVPAPDVSYRSTFKFAPQADNASAQNTDAIFFMVSPLLYRVDYDLSVLSGVMQASCVQFETLARIAIHLLGCHCFENCGIRAKLRIQAVCAYR